MSDQPAAAAVVAREARSIHTGLKALLARDVWANYREADFQRKNLRRRYLHLLLLHPGAREAREAGTHLWMQTSYAFIALYKQRLARPAHSGTNAHNNNGNNNNNTNNNTTVETRKLLQRFRQFLADEERFWRALVLRLQRAYGVPLPADALPPELLASLSIASASNAGNANATDDPGTGTTAAEDRMNHFGFPPDASPVVVPVPESDALSALSKTLVCLGDIARYREQYKVVGNANVGPKGKGYGGNNRNGGGEGIRPNYMRARALYLAAHALAPGEGNAAHQLAILAGYESDTLASVAWYLRALCVRAPFETAGENLAGVLARAALAHAHARMRGDRGGDGNDRPRRGVRGSGRGGTANGNAGQGQGQGEGDGVGGGVVVGNGAGGGESGGGESDADDGAPPRVQIERFKRAVVLLHALWRDVSTPPTETLRLAAHTARAFARLVGARALPEELIVRVVLVAQGAVWVGRMAPPPPSLPSLTGAGENGGGGAANANGNGKERERDKEKGRRRSRKGTPAPAPPAAEQQQQEQNEIAGPGAGQGGRQRQAAHLAHLFALHTALLGVGVRELGEVDLYTAGAATASTTTTTITATGTAVGASGGPGGGGGGGRRRRGNAPQQPQPQAPPKPKPELAERISAELRRTLPALRVGSKWVLGNWGWLRLEGGGGAEGEVGEVVDEGVEAAELRVRRAAFWTTYAEFLRRLARTFPAALLPALAVSVSEPAADDDAEEGATGAAAEGGEMVELELELEEDLDVRGWLPLRGLMGGPCPLPSALAADGEEPREIEVTPRRRRTVGLREEVHPNVEQLMRIADLLRDANRIVELEDSPLALYGGQFVVKGVEAVKASAPAASAAIAIPIPVPPQVQALKRTTRFEPPPPLPAEPERGDDDEDGDDAMTERTDDDILHDAFSFLNQAESESGSAAVESDEDEIVWDLRDAPVSPVIPTARTSPKTPVRLPPIGPPVRGPPAPIATAAAAPLSPFRPPAAQLPQPITPGTQIPATTALDLLNTFSMPKPSTPKHRPSASASIATGPGELLFGVGARAPQSIWSASQDEQGLMFGGGAGGVGVGMQHQHQHQQQLHPGAQYAAGGLAPTQYGGEHAMHQRFASQDLASSSSQGSTIWASSHPSASQHHVPPGFGHQHQHPPPVHAPLQHHRVVSNSMAAAQLFPSGGDPYGYGPLSAHAPAPVSQYAAAPGMAPEHLGVFYTTSPGRPGHAFAQQQQQGQSLGQLPHQQQQQHVRHLSLGMHDPRGAAAFHGHGQQPVTPMSQLWGNGG
ncbi:hypothetical protein C8R46DRAFT_1286139 [Mycena filopes]|nr:hypothetical protein C8R46DRAFT_1286139 [Mycena filopes]